MKMKVTIHEKKKTRTGATGLYGGEGAFFIDEQASG
jgi:hypothetical protein